MTSIDWPDELPIFSRDPYEVAPRSPVIETDFGLAVRRRQVCDFMREGIQVSAHLSSTQEPILRDFYETALEMGTLSFNAQILIDGALQSMEVSFAGAPPSYVPSSKYGYVRAAARLLTHDAV